MLIFWRKTPGLVPRSYLRGWKLHAVGRVCERWR
jgi:hypothetical protein